VPTVETYSIESIILTIMQENTTTVQRKDRASITIHYTKKAEMDEMIERKGETYDDIVGKLLDCWREHCAKK
jgi:hypothetical protein